MIKAVYVIDGVRTPIGKIRGSLSTIRTDNLAAFVLQELMKRNATLDPAAINDVVLGCCNQAGEDNRNIARMALLLAGLPCTVPGETVNRLCTSGLSSIVNGARTIMVGDAELVIGGGVENMTRGPWVISKTTFAFGNDAEMYDSTFGWRFINPRMKEMYGIERTGEVAENLRIIYKISREDQDKFALWSQQKASTAQKNRRFVKEIAPINISRNKDEIILFSEDEFIRPDTTLEKLAALKPSFCIDGTVTAGNSSGMNDGAAVVLLASEDAIKKYHLKPLARIVSNATIATEPHVMGITPVEASLKALKKAGLTLDAMDIIEINEAFAAQALACTRGLGLSDYDVRVNPNGGCIALGHPLAMSGTRIFLTAAIELKEKNKKYALVALAAAVGQGTAVILEKI